MTVSLYTKGSGSKPGNLGQTGLVCCPGSAQHMKKKVFITGWLLTLLSVIAGLFWYNDWVYQLPTPIPQNYKPVLTGSLVAIDPGIPLQKDKPILLHFFNPDCPCSRFNRPHFKTLVRQFGQHVNFVVVVISRKPYSPQQIQDKLDLTLPVVRNVDLARLCGVYSTPQAVLLDKHHRLVYRGNYNRSRYCTDPKTNYAQLALRQLLLNQSERIYDVQALTAYGCGIPYCSTNRGL